MISLSNPVATIFVSDGMKDGMAPIVASFSSRGPSPISPDILKVPLHPFLYIYDDHVKNFVSKILYS